MGFFDFLFSENYKTTSKVYLDENGYYRFKDSDKLVHRWAAEIKLGRRLTRFPVGFPYLEAVDHFKHHDICLHLVTPEVQHFQKDGFL